MAARRHDGALWVLKSGRPAVSVERTLAPAAVLLVLPLAVIAIATEDHWHDICPCTCLITPSTRQLELSSRCASALRAFQGGIPQDAEGHL
jgi:hypothetical protein